MFGWPAVVYIFCFITSAVCAGLLVRSFMRHKTALLLWSATCFLFLSLNNLAVVLDFLIFPQIDLMTVRAIASLAGVSTLLFGFIWEVDR